MCSAQDVTPSGLVFEHSFPWVGCGGSALVAGPPSSWGVPYKSVGVRSELAPWWHLFCLPQAFSEYQIQQMTANFVDQFGFSDEEFADQEDNVK